MRISPSTPSRFAALISALTLSLGAAVPGAAYAQAVGGSDRADIQVVGRRIPPKVPARQIDGVAIDGAVNIIGFDGAKPNAGGRFAFNGSEVTFGTSKAHYSIPFTALRSFTIEHSNKGLMRGTKGLMASFAPQGVGQLYSLFRPGAETLTLFYADEHDGLHGAVLILPKTRKDDVLRAFADAGLTPAAAPIVRLPDADQSADPGSATRRPMGSSGRHNVQVALPVSSAQGVPMAYIAGAYEELVAQMAKGGSFENVYRQGDDRADVHALNLTMTITQLKKGNAGLRGAVPVVGMIVGKTQIEAEIRLADADGMLLLEKDVKGSKRIPGENIAATKSLAQRVSKSLEKGFGAKDDNQPSKLASN
jgi:hypothetical protein